jgi:hypothetical protein
LREAAEEVAQCVQSELHAVPSPLHLDDAVELWTARRWYLEALIFLESNRLAKAVEASVSPGGQPLAICLGSAKIHEVQTVRGLIPMHGAPGCLCTFPDAPYGPGFRWPRWCPSCQTRKTNRLNAAKSVLRRRVAAAARSGVLTDGRAQGDPHTQKV